mmetsp:Transcript_53585/g.117582  ORF Transcript_53585/g.117582 Transcript_53585/m.117582 type:complete len:261 (-) Transcript_53585:109-891(-)
MVAARSTPVIPAVAPALVAVTIVPVAIRGTVVAAPAGAPLSGGLSLRSALGPLGCVLGLLVRLSELRQTPGSSPTPEPPRLPVVHGPPTLHVHQHALAVDLAPVRLLVSILQVTLVSELDESVPSRLPVQIMNNLHPLDRAPVLELTFELLLRGVVGHARHKQGLVRVPASVAILLGPVLGDDGLDILLVLINGFLQTTSLPLLRCLESLTRGWRSRLEQLHILPDPGQRSAGLLLHRVEMLRGRAWREQRQDVGWQPLG